MKHKKSQMELLGLAIIIVLISLAILFVIQFVVVKKPSELQKEFTHKELASNIINTMLSTTTECREMSINQLIEDCIVDKYISDCPGNQNSCAYVTDVIKNILEKTVSNWNKKYYLNITQAGELSSLGPFGTPCASTEEIITSSPCCVLPTTSAPIIITLQICS